MHPATAHLEDLLALATKRRWRPAQLLEHLAEPEQEDRARRSLERRLARGRIGRFTPITDFDWTWPKRIDRPAIEAALKGDFLPDARNIILVAARGLGKTTIAQNIAHAVLVLFTTAAQMLLDLGSQDSARRGLAQRLNAYAAWTLLCIDEVGFLSYDARAADLLFQIISRRYERRASSSMLCGICSPLNSIEIEIIESSAAQLDSTMKSARGLTGDRSVGLVPDSTESRPTYPSATGRRSFPTRRSPPPSSMARLRRGHHRH